MLVALAVVEQRPLARGVQDVFLGERPALGRAVAAASSRICSAALASPPARFARSSTASRAAPPPRAPRRRARGSPTSSSSESAVSSITVHRDRSAELTSKYGFSVVAPMSVTRPSSTACSTESCCALLKRWISSMKRIVRTSLPPSRSRARAITARTSSTRAETAEISSNAAPVRSATIRAIVVFPVPGGPEEDHRRRPVLLDREPERRARREHVLLADELLEPRRAQPNGQRGVLGLAFPRGFREEVGHAGSMLPPR